MARPNRSEERWGHERHFEATHTQIQHEHGARENREFLASVNHGRPAIAATARPGEFRGHDGMANRPGHDRPMDNRVDNRAVNRNVPHPQNSGHNMDRPMPRENARNEPRNANRPMPRQDNPRGGEQRMAPRPDNPRGGEQRMATRQDNPRGGEQRMAQRPDNRSENHGPAATRPNSNRPENRHESAPRQEKPEQGHDRKSR
jgi:hypothetical protein